MDSQGAVAVLKVVVVALKNQVSSLIAELAGIVAHVPIIDLDHLEKVLKVV